MHFGNEYETTLQSREGKLFCVGVGIQASLVLELEAMDGGFAWFMSIIRMCERGNVRGCLKNVASGMQNLEALVFAGASFNARLRCRLQEVQARCRPGELECDTSVAVPNT